MMGAPGSSFARRPILDGLRGLAVLLVLLFHFDVPHFSGGFLGVDLFFVLSGYLITAKLLDESRAGRIDLRAFWLRRIRRLMPPLVVFLAVLIVLLRKDGEWSFWAQWRGDLYATATYTLNWRFITAKRDYFFPMAASPIMHLWSLAVEEQFYLAWPILLALLAPRVRRGALLVWFCAIAAASIATMAFLATRAPVHAFFGTDARLHELVIGGIAAALLADRPAAQPGSRSQALLSLALLAALAAVVGLTPEESPFYFRGGSALFSLLAAALICTAELRPTRILERILTALPLRWCGKISYAAYLWHWPIAMFRRGWIPDGLLGDAEGIALSLLCAAISWVAIEQPFSRAMSPLTGPRTKLLLAGVLAAWVALVGETHWALATTSQANWDTQIFSMHCPHSARICELQSAPSSVDPITIADIGDSILMSMSPGFTALAQREGVRFVQAATPDCSLTDLPVIRALVDGKSVPLSAEEQACLANVVRDQQTLIETFHPAIVIASSVHEARIIVAEDGRLIQKEEPEHRERLLAALDRMLARVTAGGAHLILLVPLPAEAPIDCGHTTRQRCWEVTPNETVVYQKSVEVEFAARHPREVTLVDLRDEVCGKGPGCPGKHMRFDGFHFTAEAARIAALELWRQADGDALLRAARAGGHKN